MDPNVRGFFDLLYETLDCNDIYQTFTRTDAGCNMPLSFRSSLPCLLVTTDDEIRYRKPAYGS